MTSLFSIVPTYYLAQDIVLFHITLAIYLFVYPVLHAIARENLLPGLYSLTWSLYCVREPTAQCCCHKRIVYPGVN